MSKTANSSWETTGKPIVVLTVISLIVSLLLALVLITGGTTAAFPGQSFAENGEIQHDRRFRCRRYFS